MTIVDEALSRFARSFGLTRRGRYAWRAGSDLVSAVWLQKSSWGDQWYVNIGWTLTAPETNPSPKYDAWHVSTRLKTLLAAEEAQTTGERAEELLDLATVDVDDDRARQQRVGELLSLFEEIVLPVLERTDSIQRLAHELKLEHFYFGCRVKREVQEQLGIR